MTMKYTCTLQNKTKNSIIVSRDYKSQIALESNKDLNSTTVQAWFLMCNLSGTMPT